MAKKRRKKRTTIPIIRRVKPGLAPGTTTVDPDALKPHIRVFSYGLQDLHEHQPDDCTEIALERRPARTLWINMDGLGDQAALNWAAERFNIHKLALEDIINVFQRAKVEPYDDNIFIVARMVTFNSRLATEQVSMVLGEDYLLTFQERPGDSFDPVRERIRSGRPTIRGGGPGYLTYALFDALVDAYFPVLEVYGDRLSELDEQVSTNPRPEYVRQIHGIKRDLLVLRRAMWPHREAINQLMRDESRFISDQTRLYLRDCYDHCVQVLDMIETYRELASSLQDAYMSAVGNRMNEIMKVLTIFAAIFIPLTFVAGLYGMNFEHMPELRWKWSYPVALGVMCLLAAVMLMYFRNRGWLGDTSAKKTESVRDDGNNGLDAQ